MEFRTCKGCNNDFITSSAEVVECARCVAELEELERIAKAAVCMECSVDLNTPEVVANGGNRFGYCPSCFFVVPKEHEVDEPVHDRSTHSEDLP